MHKEDTEILPDLIFEFSVNEALHPSAANQIMKI